MHRNMRKSLQVHAIELWDIRALVIDFMLRRVRNRQCYYYYFIILCIYFITFL